MSKRTNVWLSIDWDYFCIERPEWEFGHAELPDFHQLLWNMRLKLFSELGKDLIQETSLEYADPHPKKFWQKLEQLGYTFGNLKTIVVADSHGWAYEVFKRSNAEGPSLKETRLVHFDAHHDLAYNFKRFEQDMYTSNVTCENWHLMTLFTQLRLKSLIVYPSWKGLDEWERTIGKGYRMVPRFRKTLSKMVTPCVWPSKLVKKAAGDVEVIFICRSGGWTPPWHDRDFTKFVRSLATRTGVPFDTPFVPFEHLDPLVPRVFDPQYEPMVSEKVYLAGLTNHA